MTADVLLVGGIRTVLRLSLQVMVAVDEAAEHVDSTQVRARALLRGLPVLRAPDEL